MKYGYFVIIIILSLQTAHSQNDEINLKPGDQIYLESKAKIYDGPRVTTKLLLEIAEISKVKVISSENANYVFVDYDGLFGYVPVWHILSDEDIRAKEEKKRILTIFNSIEKEKNWIKSNRSNIHQNPSSDSKIIQHLDKGKIVYIQKRQGEWALIKHKNSIINKYSISSEEEIDEYYATGWIHSNELSSERVEPLSTMQKIRIEKENAAKERQSNFLSKNKDLTENLRSQILNGTISIGMTKEMVQASWGEPSDINKTITASKVREQWIYGTLSNRKYVYFENGNLYSIQN